jgi:hypothetical protein
MQKLPDFDEMYALAEEAASARSEMVMLEGLESSMSARFMRSAILNSDYWLGGKAPTATVHLAKIIAKVGNTEEDEEAIKAVRDRLKDVTYNYIEAMEKLKIMHAMISVYQTESANKRVTLA